MLNAPSRSYRNDSKDVLKYRATHSMGWKSRKIAVNGPEPLRNVEKGESRGSRLDEDGGLVMYTSLQPPP